MPKKSDLVQERPIKCRDHIDAMAETIWILRESWEAVKIPPPVSIRITEEMAKQIRHLRHPSVEQNNYKQHTIPNYAGTIAGIDLIGEQIISHNRLTGRRPTSFIIDEMFD